MGRVTLFALAASLLLGCAHSTQVAPSALAVVSKQLPLAYNTRDIDLFDSLLDRNYQFTEFDSLGNPILTNSREDELAFLRSGPRFVAVHFEPTATTREQDLEVVKGTLQMTLITSNDTVRLTETPTYRLRQTDNGVWKILSWEKRP